VKVLDEHRPQDVDLERQGRTWVVVLGDRDGLRWVVKNDMMAWTKGSARKAAEIRCGDGLILYVTRGAFHNPARGEAQLVAEVRALEQPRPLAQPFLLAGRTFVSACRLRFTLLLPEKKGAPVRPIVENLAFVRRKDTWGQYFRSGLIEVPGEDFDVMAQALRDAAYGS
jgi:hypothetical protein